MNQADYYGGEDLVHEMGEDSALGCAECGGECQGGHGLGCPPEVYQGGLGCAECGGGCAGDHGLGAPFSASAYAPPTPGQRAGGVVSQITRAWDLAAPDDLRLSGPRRRKPKKGPSLLMLGIGLAGAYFAYRAWFSKPKAKKKR